MELIPPIHGEIARAAVQGPIFMLTVAIAVLLILVGCIMTIVKATRQPSIPQGWNKMNYAGSIAARKPVTSLVGFQPTTPMVNFSVATANFGGIYTEPSSSYFGTNTNPWLGTVSTEVAQLQVEAGARAIIFDIWPNPADPAQPVVCAMVDTSQWAIQSWWTNSGGLNAGMTSSYSNWQLLTRNTVPAGEMVNAAVNTAFGGNNPQKSDPFFLILRLHGAMSQTYLNTLGAAIQQSTQRFAMGPEYINVANTSLCNTPFSEFVSSDNATGKVCVIVSPDLNTGLRDDFATNFKASTLAQVTNLVEFNPQQMVFQPGSAQIIPQTKVANCTTGGPQLPLQQATFTIVQPSIGGKSTSNDDLYAGTSYQTCLSTGAQFVAVNLFSPSTGDGALGRFFQDDLFGVRSFAISASLK